MTSEHSHSHEEHRSRDRTRLSIMLVLSLLYMVAEIIGGWLTNSLALLADAGHMFSDVGSLGLSLFAIWLAQRPARPSHTYGYYRTEILAALVNAATLIAVAIGICYEAFQRIGEPPEVQGGLMMVIAVGGLLINLVGLRILHAGEDGSLNVRGAWLHVLTDTLGSIGAIVAGLCIWLFDWRWVDPAASVLISVLVLYASWGLLKEAVAVLMEAAPSNLNIEEIQATIDAIEGIDHTHDLHVWTITSGMVALSAHVVINKGASAEKMLTEIQSALHERFAIDHTTIQIETERHSEHTLPV